MPGRRPQPTKLKLLRGNPGRRPINEAEPQPKTDIPECPEHLGEEARAEWGRISLKLHRLGLLTEIDGAGLAAYCFAWGVWVDACRALQKTGPIVRAPKTGVPMQNPYFSVANSALDRMRTMLIEFGMTPSSRSRITTGKGGKEKDDDEIKKLLG